MHVLITGASGYFGSVLFERLARSPQVSKLSVFARSGTARKPTNLPLSVETVHQDELHTAGFKARKFDAIFHLAAGRSLSEPEQIASSLALTSQLIQVAAEAGVHRIFNASSQAVYGLNQELWSENTAPAPVTIHGMAKYSSELMASAAFAQAVSIRFSKLVGPSPKFRIDASEIPHVLCRHALKGAAVVIKHPQQKFDLLDVRDAADACVRLLAIEAHGLPKVLNIGSGRQTSTAEMATLVDAVGRHEFDAPLNAKIDESVENGAYRSFGMSIDLVQKLCGWKPVISPKTTVRDIFSQLCAIK